jgi:hypothetical protein
MTSTRSQSPARQKADPGPKRWGSDPVVTYPSVNEYLKGKLKRIKCPNHGALTLRPDGKGRGHKVKCVLQNGDYHKFTVYHLVAHIKECPMEVPEEEWNDCLSEYPRGLRGKIDIDENACTKDNPENSENAPLEVPRGYKRITPDSSEDDAPHLAKQLGQKQSGLGFRIKGFTGMMAQIEGSGSSGARVGEDLEMRVGRMFQSFEERMVALESWGIGINKAMEKIAVSVDKLADRVESMKNGSNTSEVEQLRQEYQHREETLRNEIQGLRKQVLKLSEERERPRLAPIDRTQSFAEVSSEGEWKTKTSKRSGGPQLAKAQTSIRPQNRFEVLEKAPQGNERPEMREVEGFPLIARRPEYRPISLNDVSMGIRGPSTKPKTRTICLRFKSAPYRFLKRCFEEFGTPRYAIMEWNFLSSNLLALITYEEYADRVIEVIEEKSNGLVLPEFDPLNSEYRDLLGGESEEGVKASLSRAIGAVAFATVRNVQCNYVGKREAITEAYLKIAQQIIRSGWELTPSPEAKEAMKMVEERVRSNSKTGPKVLLIERQLSILFWRFLPELDHSYLDSQMTPFPQGVAKSVQEIVIDEDESVSTSDLLEILIDS